MKRHRFLKTLLLCLVLVASALSVFTGAVSVGLPTVFVGDEAWYQYDRYPILERNSLLYVPAVLFEAADGVTLTRSETWTALLLLSGDGSAAFDMASGTAWGRDGTAVSLPCYRYGEEWYLPAAFVCENLGLKLETVQNGDSWILRISDGNSRISLDALAAMYSQDEIVSGELPDFTIRSGDRVQHRVYFCFYVFLDDTVPELLRFLAEQKVKGTFFVDYAEALENQELLCSIAAAGHSLGVSLAGIENGDPDDALAYLTRVTRRVCNIVGAGRTALSISGSDSTLKSGGHDMDTELSNLNNEYKNLYLRSLSRESTVIYSFYTCESAYDVIPRVLQYRYPFTAALPMAPVGANS